MMYLRNRVASVKYALNGIRIVLKSQHNAWIHVVATVGVCGAGFYLRLTKLEWSIIVLTITLVWMAETFNTALEFLADATCPHYHPLVGKAKDVAAGAVMLTAMGSVIIALIILIT